MEEKSLYLSDLMTGLIAMLALRGVPSLSLRRGLLDRALESLRDTLAEEATNHNLALKFRIRTHPVHGDSVAVQDALYEAAKRDLISLDNPEFQVMRLKVSAHEAPRYLEMLPGHPAMYERLADKLVQFYAHG